MKYLSNVVAFALATAATAQRIAIGAPLEWTSISPGDTLTVEVDRGVSY